MLEDLILLFRIVIYIRDCDGFDLLGFCRAVLQRVEVCPSATFFGSPNPSWIAARERGLGNG